MLATNAWSDTISRTFQELERDTTTGTDMIDLVLSTIHLGARSSITATLTTKYNEQLVTTYYSDIAR
mgnify:CR=1 FL=1